MLSVGTRGPGRGLAGTEPVLDRLWQECHRGIPAQWDQSPGPGAAGERVRVPWADRSGSLAGVSVGTCS